MSEFDVLILEQIESDVDGLLYDDEYYEKLATPLKSAEIFKAEHRKNLVEFLQFKELRSQLDHATELILNDIGKNVPLSDEDLRKIHFEFENSRNHYIEFKKPTAEGDEEDDPVVLQELFGLSNETLLHIYAFAIETFKQKKYEDAASLYLFLTMLAPHIPNYWVGQGTCLQALNRHREAIEAFEAVHILDPSLPHPLYYIVESYLNLDDKEMAKEKFLLLEEIISHLSSEEKKVWSEIARNIKTKIV